MYWYNYAFIITKFNVDVAMEFRMSQAILIKTLIHMIRCAFVSVKWSSAFSAYVVVYL